MASTTRLDAAERQRQRIKWRYHNTIKNLDESRQLVKELTQRHQSAVERQRSLLAESGPSQNPRLEALRLYEQATELVNELVRAKEKLQRDVDLHQKSTHRLRNVMRELEDSMGQTREATEDVLVVLFFTVDPFSVDDCVQIILPVYLDIRLILDRHMSSTANDSVFGWHSRRLNDNSKLHLSLQKTVAGTTSLELALKTWGLLQGPIEFAELFSPALHARVQSVQVINDSNMILYDYFDSRAAGGPLHCVYLASLMKIDNGHAILFQSIDRARLRITGHAPVEFNDPEHWMDVCTWYIFEDCDAAQVDVILGGTVEGTRRADEWLNEMTFLSMRWESKMVGPRSLLP